MQPPDVPLVFTASVFNMPVSALHYITHYVATGIQRNKIKILHKERQTIEIQDLFHSLQNVSLNVSLNKSIILYSALMQRGVFVIEYALYLRAFLPEHNLSNGDSMIMIHLLQCNKG